MATWRIVYNGRACSLAVARGSLAEDIDFNIKQTISFDGDGLQYELADGSLVVLSSALPDGTELHCKPQQHWAALSSTHAAQAPPTAPSGFPSRARRHGTRHVQDGGQMMKLYIKNIVGKVFPIEARTDDTLDDLAHRIQDKEGACMPTE